MFSLCIPTMDIFDDFLSIYLPKYINNSLIIEIIITDENGFNKINNALPILRVVIKLNNIVNNVI